jgi:hypothetical protein
LFKEFSDLADLQKQLYQLIYRQYSYDDILSFIDSTRYICLTIENKLGVGGEIDITLAHN